MNIGDKLDRIKIRKLNRKVLRYPNKISLCKDNKYENISIDFSKCLISASNKKDIELLKQKIKNFLITMNSKCKNFDNTIFINNFEKTFFNVTKAKKEMVQGTSKVIFSNNLNRVLLHSFEALNHELLHLSSYTLDDLEKKTECLFEGYTQLLTERYFGKFNNGIAYFFEVKFLQQIENILGKDLLENAYFKGEFVNTIIQLEEYITLNEFSLLLFYMQKIYIIRANDEILSKKNEVQRLLNKISYILFKCTKNKINKIDGIEEKIKYLEFCEYFFTTSTLSMENETVKFNLADEDMVFDFYDELKANRPKIKEIN